MARMELVENKNTMKDELTDQIVNRLKLLIK